jgi:hypothetical protein
MRANDRGKYRMKPSYLRISLLTILLAGCAATPQQQPPIDEPQVNLAGYPPPFRDGYLDGCNSARDTTKPPVKDEDRYKNDSMYAAGWRDGFDICSQKQYD